MEFLGLTVNHPFEIIPLSHIELVEKNNLQFQWIGNNAERWEIPNLELQPVLRGDAKFHAFQTQIMKNPLRTYTIDAWQIHNNLPVTGFPSPSTTAELSGAETEVAIQFSANISAVRVAGFARRFFTFGNHKKLYLLENLGVSAGGRSGTMTFVPNAQAAVASGTVVNFINPKVTWALQQGFPPRTRTTQNGLWQTSLDLVEIWEE